MRWTGRAGGGSGEGARSCASVSASDLCRFQAVEAMVRTRAGVRPLRRPAGRSARSVSGQHCCVTKTGGRRGGARHGPQQAEIGVLGKGRVAPSARAGAGAAGTLARVRGRAGVCARVCAPFHRSSRAPNIPFCTEGFSSLLSLCSSVANLLEFLTWLHSRAPADRTSQPQLCMGPSPPLIPE